MRPVLALVVSLLLLGPANAEDSVYFADPELKAAVEQTLWISDPTPSDMLALTSLQCPYSEIRNLTGIEYATNLQSLSLFNNLVTDISALSGLVSLRTLNLEGNRITNISALSSLTALQELNLKQNRIDNISVLSGLTNMRTLSIHRNNISDISPLTVLTCLRWLDLRINPLNHRAYETDIAQIRANNPGIWISYDPTYGRRLVITSSPGGTVVSPGVGEFVYEYNDVVWLEAVPDPGFTFARWSGEYSSTERFTSFLVDQDYDLHANFTSMRNVIYVDHSAPRDDTANGTPEKPFSLIQEAIDVAPNGATILVAEGLYRENLDVRGKSICLKGFDTDVANAGAWPVIDGAGEGLVARFTNGKSENCALSGFVITGGKGASAGAISCSGGSVTIANCLIVGNRMTNWSGGIVRCADTSATFINCTIADNYAAEYGSGLYLVNSHVAVTNSIIWGNASQEIITDGGEAPSVRYSDIAGGWPGPGNSKADPLFARRGYWARGNNPNVRVGANELGAAWFMGDYHLNSQAGRWNPNTQQWVQDTVTSLCIDAGDPDSPVGREPSPNGDIVNMGTYGGTVEASKSQVGP